MDDYVAYHIHALTIDTETRKVNLASLGLRFDGDQAFGSNARILPRMNRAFIPESARAMHFPEDAW